MHHVSSSAFTQRPVDGSRNPRVPMTEWEYNEKHGGEILADHISSESSGLCEFSVSSDSDLDSTDKVIDDLERCQLTGIPSSTQDDEFLVSADARQVGNALQGNLDYLAESHRESQQRLEQMKSATKSSVSSFKYGYFDDLSDSHNISKAMNDSIASDFISSPSGTAKSEAENVVIADEIDIEDDFISDKHVDTLNRSEFNISDDSDLEKSIPVSISIQTTEILKSEHTIGTTELLKPITGKTVSFLDQSMKTSELLKPVPSIVDTKNSDFIETSELMKPVQQTKDSDFLESVEMQTSELLKTVQSTKNSDFVEMQTSELMKPIGSPKQSETSDLLKTNSMSISDDFEIEESIEVTEKSQTKSVLDNKKKTVRMSSSNPPTMFTRYLEENPPPPKPKVEVPTKFKYTVSEIEDKSPEMWKKNPPKPTPRRSVAFDDDDKLPSYKPKKILDQAPSCVDPEKYKKKPSLTVNEIADDAVKQFNTDDAEKAVADYRRRQKLLAMIDERLADPAPSMEKKQKKEKKDDRKAKAVAKKAFYEPAETKAVKLRNQTVRQNLAVIHEAKRVEAEEAEERAAHARAVGLRLRPELKKLADEAEAKLPKKDKYKNIGGRFNDPKAVETLEKAAQKVKATEEILRRNDRSLILRDCGNKRRKEAMAESKRAEAESLQSRKTANERLMRKWKN